LFLAILLLAMAAGSAHAFGLSGIGGRIGSADPNGLDGTMAGGAHLDFADPGTQLHMQPNFLFWESDGLSDANPNFDLYYHFAPSGRVSPYVGGGAGLHFYGVEGPNDPSTDVGINLFGGLLMPAPGASFFMEGRYIAADRSQAAIYGGVTLPLSR
jgi:hypothetical protein